MITREQVESLGFVYKQKSIKNQIDFVNVEIKTMATLSLEGTVDIIFENYKKSWGNINSIDEMRKILELITKSV